MTARISENIGQQRPPANTTIQTPDEFRRAAENELLKTLGYDDEDIAAMSPEERSHDLRSFKPPGRGARHGGPV